MKLISQKLKVSLEKEVFMRKKQLPLLGLYLKITISESSLTCEIII